MDDELHRQSCGMLLSKEFGNPGTNADGTRGDEFCVFCFVNGDFTNPNQTLEEMIASSVENMTSDLQMPLERATELAYSFIPTLRRWQQ